MAAIVARHEDDRQPGNLADPQRAGWFAPRGPDALLAHILKARQIVNARAANDAENRLHAEFLQPKSKRAPCGALSSSLHLRSGVNVRPHLLLGEVEQAGEH